MPRSRAVNGKTRSVAATTAGKLWVQAVYSNAPDETEERRLEVRTFEPGVHPAEAMAEVGMTINLGNYESLRITAGVRLPCYPEEIEAAQQRAFELAERVLFQKVEEARQRV
jgi:hypothetical protein